MCGKHTGECVAVCPIRLALDGRQHLRVIEAEHVGFTSRVSTLASHALESHRMR